MGIFKRKTIGQIYIFSAFGSFSQKEKEVECNSGLKLGLWGQRKLRKRKAALPLPI